MRRRRNAKLFFALLLFFAAQPIFARDDIVIMRVEGRAVFRDCGDGETDATARARQIEGCIDGDFRKLAADCVCDRAGARPEDRKISVAAVPTAAVRQARARPALRR